MLLNAVYVDLSSCTRPAKDILSRPCQCHALIWSRVVESLVVAT